jgi:hypothetical protein
VLASQSCARVSENARCAAWPLWLSIIHIPPDNQQLPDPASSLPYGLSCTEMARYMHTVKQIPLEEVLRDGESAFERFCTMARALSENSVAAVLAQANPTNCWEHMKCGRENECPAFPDYGRACFAVTGTRCRGREQGTYALKISKCRLCSFYQELMGGE